jgi:hypothetical protein
MRALLGFLSAMALLGPSWASAQMLPHRAEYTLRLGAAANAPRVGTAVQDLILDCNGWRMEREIKGELAVTPSLKMNVVSRLDGEEPDAGNVFRFQTQLSQNGSARRTNGMVQRDGDALNAEIDSPNGASHLALPDLTFMPVSWIKHVIDKLRTGSAPFAGFLFDAEGTRDAFMVDVKRAERTTLRRRPPADKPIDIDGEWWPVALSFSKRGASPQKPLFALTAQLYESGVVDRLTVDAHVAIVTADLQSLEMHKVPACARH